MYLPQNEARFFPGEADAPPFCESYEARMRPKEWRAELRQASEPGQSRPKFVCRLV